MTDSDLSAVLARLWAGFLPLARSRVEALETYAAQLSVGTEVAPSRTAAADAAHKLAGALGSYARPGSDEASRLEVLLHPSAGAPDTGEVSALVAALRAAVDA